MIVVADTSPLNYLIQIDAVEVLRDLYGRVLLPGAVVEELRAAGAPLTVSEWANDLSPWVGVVQVAGPEVIGLNLGNGESEAIILALSRHTDLILLDDGPARNVARSRRLFVTGTLGVLKAAADEGLLGFVESVAQIRQLGFRMTDLLVEEILAED